MTREQIQRLIKSIDEEDITSVEQVIEADINSLTLSLLDEENILLPIHYAAMYGKLSIVKLLLSRNKETVNARDYYERTPLFLAAANGYLLVVKYLLSENANIWLACNRPGSAEHCLNPLDIAKLKNYYEIENLLVSNMCSHLSKAILPSFMRTGEQALDYIALDPSVSSLFLQDARINGLISSSDNCHVKPDTIDWYKRSEKNAKRLSLYLHIDKETPVLETEKDREIKAAPSVKVFKSVQELGQGAYGIVRLFRSAQGAEIAVKSLKEDLVVTSPKAREDLRVDLRREVGFTKLAYPADTISKRFEFDYNDNKKNQYTNRFLMPRVPGSTAWSLMATITELDKLAKIILEIAKEVQRINSLGIIHGDLNANNIMINYQNEQCIIRLLDFACASGVTEASVLLYEAKVLGTTWIAPELCRGDNKNVKPHFSQDVYALGYSLKKVLGGNDRNADLMQRFPSIELFISRALNDDPMIRPTLDGFCAELSEALRLIEAEDKHQIDSSPCIIM